MNSYRGTPRSLHRWIVHRLLWSPWRSPCTVRAPVVWRHAAHECDGASAHVQMYTPQQVTIRHFEEVISGGSDDQLCRGWDGNSRGKLLFLNRRCHSQRGHARAQIRQSTKCVQLSNNFHEHFFHNPFADALLRGCTPSRGRKRSGLNTWKQFASSISMVALLLPWCFLPKPDGFAAEPQMGSRDVKFRVCSKSVF